ncbi:MAG: heme ABC exporter ATP-binding protein CcmA [Pseudomonadota bacterium]
MVSAIHAQDVSLERGGRLILSGLSFSVRSGAALVLKGANGAGKTTLLRGIAGFLPLAGGAMEVEGGDGESEIGGQSHYVGHLSANKPAMSVFENLMFWCDLNGGESPRIEQALDAFDLSALAHIPASYLSAGQRRRLGLARVLVAERPIWLLDEPTTALDSSSQAAFIRVCNSHLAAGGLLIAATHMPLTFDTFQELQLGAGGPDT